MTRRGMQNFSDATLNKVQIRLDQDYKPIKFNDEVEVENLHDLFRELYNDKKDTYTLEGRLDCRRGKGRSYIAAYLLCRHYFPKISYKEMYRELQRCVDYSNEGVVRCCKFWGYHNHAARFWTCPDIGRARFQGILDFPRLEL